jgi:hypothetical protein
MVEPLTPFEKKRVDAFHSKRKMEAPYIAAEILTGRHLREFVDLQGEIEKYLKEW